MKSRKIVPVLLFSCLCAVLCCVTLCGQTPVKTADPAQKIASAEKTPLKPSVKSEKKETAAPVVKTEKKAVVQKKKSNPFKGTFWALIPPVVAILLALITKEVYSSLFMGVLLGGLLSSEFSLIKTMDCVISKGLLDAIKATSGIFVFLVILGTIVAMISQSGAAASFGDWAKKNVKSRAGTIFATIVLGVLIFVDDYFNCLTVGSVMSPATDAQKISRAKLAYIIDATAAPVCMIAPVSSWAAAVSQYASGTPYSGLELFIRAIPYNFYSLLTLLFLVMLTFFKLDFGPMKQHEKNALEKGDLFTVQPPESESAQLPLQKGRILDIVIPLILLTILCVYALIHVGGYSSGKGFIAAFGDTDATVGLPWGAVTAFIFCVGYYAVRKILSVKECIALLPKGFSLMVPAIMILTLATSLKNMTVLLGAKDFVSAFMNSTAGSLANFLPAVIFLVASFLAFATGTSWGTFGILIPIVVAIFPASSPLLYIGMSACLAGAVCGDHCSPISDTTIMASAGARCDHLCHVVTQMPYVIVVAIVSFIGFTCAGLLQNWGVSFLLCVILLLGFCIVVKLHQRKLTDKKV